MSELKPCPFCGSNDIVYEEALSVTYCNDCGGELDEGFGSDWNTRPIEDALNARIAELEADNKKTFDLVRKLRMYCIWANWDNPDTEDEFNEFDVEVCKWLSKFMEREE